MSDAVADRAVDELRYNELYERAMVRIRDIGMEPYLDLGSETRSGTRLNREYMAAISFEMNLLGSEPATAAASLFGHRLKAPIIASALCESRILKRLGPWTKPYLEQIAAGLADAGSMMSTGDVEFDELRQIVAQGAPVLHIVKPYADKKKVYAHLEAAESMGCVAVGMDVDAMYLEKAWDEVPGPPYLGHQTNEDLAGYIKSTKLPFVIKGVLSVKDARKAKELGAAAIVVSNHGGEAIDYTAPVLEVLPAVRAAVPDLTILVDSGFRRGSDVFKALALGADGVGLGAQLVVGCAAAGREGVRRMMAILQEELERIMSVTGCPTVADIEPSVLHLPR
ncbi:MAG TPA: alpha-hydroxy-acid oxidizing protein [Candidatus Dormibacteraeota bacterium]|nr:alpha-hydroxy-acid oxidizing protein [Candidatus Dormibacteraeota bacterium]